MDAAVLVDGIACRKEESNPTIAEPLALRSWGTLFERSPLDGVRKRDL